MLGEASDKLCGYPELFDLKLNSNLDLRKKGPPRSLKVSSQLEENQQEQSRYSLDATDVSRGSLYEATCSGRIFTCNLSCRNKAAVNTSLLTDTDIIQWLTKPEREGRGQAAVAFRGAENPVVWPREKSEAKIGTFSLVYSQCLECVPEHVCYY